jgi:hypothetical protein
MPQGSTKELAEKIARILESDTRNMVLAELSDSIKKINERLTKIETSLNPQSPSPNLKSLHPSQEKFAVAEAIADEIFAGITKEKACTFEPNGKPCDHCSMCSSRGF